jgi:hypothetical protein
MTKAIERAKGQSTLEYIVVLSAVVGLIIYAAATWVKPAVVASMGQAELAIDNSADHFTPQTN